MASVAGGDVSDQPLRPVRFAPGVSPFQRAGVHRLTVSHARSLPLCAPPNLFQLVVHFLGYAAHDRRPPGVCTSHDWLYPDGDPAGRARPYPNSWGLVSPLPAAGTEDSSGTPGESK